MPSGIITARIGFFGRQDVNRKDRTTAHLHAFLKRSSGVDVTIDGACERPGAQTGHWSYEGDEGPSHWGDLNPDFASCKNGHRQSPIDICNPQKADLSPIRFDFKPSPLHIIDNGHTIMVNYAPGSSIRVGDKQYALKQFHFHRPSEEKINGKTYEMVVHLVHADQHGNLAVVAILLERGKNNSGPSAKTRAEAHPVGIEESEGIATHASTALNRF